MIGRELVAAADVRVGDRIVYPDSSKYGVAGEVVSEVLAVRHDAGSVEIVVRRYAANDTWLMQATTEVPVLVPRPEGDTL